MIFRPKPIRIPQPFFIDHKVGGIKGLSGTRTLTEFSISNDSFYPGEQIKCRVEANNTQCSTSIKSFKFKLLRKSSFLVHDKYHDVVEYIDQHKIPGCEKK